MTKPIELLYARNVISRVAGVVEQALEFSILVENLAFEKLVEVHWAGRSGIWQTLKAEHQYGAGGNREVWRAELKLRASTARVLPGSVRFALHCRVLESDYWDNNFSRDYLIDADCGVMAQNGISVLNIGQSRRLERSQHSYSVSAAVHRSVHAKCVTIHWTTDNWKTTQKTRCSLDPNYWFHLNRSRAPNPNAYGWQIWSAEIGIGDSFGLEYALCCDTGKEEIWDNNFGSNYTSRHRPLRVLTLNLHCYQEERQDYKFDQIVRAIRDLEIDVVCFQEVAEEWNGGRGDWKSNAARIIRDRLSKCYRLSFHIHTDRSHIGFDRYWEGTAILSRFKFLSKDSGYVSQSRDPHDIHARKVVMAQIHVPYMGVVNLFSVHLSWWTGGFEEQFENLWKWADSKHTGSVSATLLCGDFNSKPCSRGYELVAATKEYEDQFLKASSPDLFKNVFEKPLQNFKGLLADDRRIDYIFLKRGGSLKVIWARVLFTEQDYGKVSDHFGYVAEFEPEA